MSELHESYLTHPEHKELFIRERLGQTEPDPRYDAEAERERLWWEFERTCRAFAESELLHGASEREAWAAVMRAVTRAMCQQGELPR